MKALVYSGTHDEEERETEKMEEEKKRERGERDSVDGGTATTAETFSNLS